jgi:hypothetical protein
MYVGKKHFSEPSNVYVYDYFKLKGFVARFNSVPGSGRDCRFRSATSGYVAVSRFEKLQVLCRRSGNSGSPIGGEQLYRTSATNKINELSRNSTANKSSVPRSVPRIRSEFPLIGKIPHRWMAFVEVRGCGATRISARRQAAAGGGRYPSNLQPRLSSLRLGCASSQNLALREPFVR